MLRKDRHLYFWSMLVCGIALIAILPDASWIYSSIAAYDSSRWAHFLEYAIVTAIPARHDFIHPHIPVHCSGSSAYSFFGAWPS